jgi:hypothetical protein
MARLIVKRKNQWINRMRLVGIYVDGLKVGTVSNGDAEEFKVAAGTHKVKAKMEWCRSNELEFTIGENETKTLALSAYKYANLIVGIELGLLALHFILKMTAGINYIIWFVIPFALVTVYYTSIGYNKYLWLREDELSFSF